MMENHIETADAARPPVSSVGISTDQAGIPEGQTGTGSDAISSDGQPVGQTFGTPTLTEDNVVGQEAQPVETQEQPVKQDPTRYEFWQSKHDTVQNELSSMKQELDYYKNTLDPISNAIKQRPEILDMLEQQSFSNGAPANQPGSPQTSQNSLKEPVNPERPMNYNEVDAYNDPESESFKYRMQKDQYRDQMLDYYKNVDSYRQRQAQQQQAMQQEQFAMNQAHQHAVNNYGWAPEKAQGFIQWAKNPANVTMDHLAKLYDASLAPSKQQTEAQQKVQEIQSRKERLQVPQPTAVATGNTPPPMNDEQSFSAGLLNLKK